MGHTACAVQLLQAFMSCLSQAGPVPGQAFASWLHSATAAPACECSACEGQGWERGWAVKAQTLLADQVPGFFLAGESAGGGEMAAQVGGCAVLQKGKLTCDAQILQAAWHAVS